MLENSGGLQLWGVTITFCLRKVVRIEMGTFHSPTNHSHQLVENIVNLFYADNWRLLSLGKTDSLDGDFSNFVLLFGLWYCETLWRGFSRQKICMGWVKHYNVSKHQTLHMERAMSTWHFDVWNMEGRTCSCSWATWKPTSFAMDAKTSWMASCVCVHSLPWMHIIIDRY